MTSDQNNRLKQMAQEALNMAPKPPTTLEDILNHNKHIMSRIETHTRCINTEKQMIEFVKKEIVPPCKFCPYDGIFRCESCRENFYEGFNKKDYPN